MRSYHKEIVRKEDLNFVKRKFTTTGGDGVNIVLKETARGRSAETKKLIGGQVLTLEKEWDDLIVLIEGATNQEAKQQMIKNLPFVHSQTTLMIKGEVSRG